MENNKKILLNFGIWFLLLFVVCLIGLSNVFALEYTDIGYVHTLSSVNGEVTIDVTYETESGAPLVINRNQVIYTQLKAMNVFISNYSFEANRQYQIEMEFPYQQLQYANTYQVYGANNELCQVNYSASIFNSQWPRWNFSCPHSTNEIYLKVYNSNNTAITSYGDWSWNYIYMRYTNTSISSDVQDTDIIINNNNMNTDRIINNNNSNTDRIIEENKKNFQECSKNINFELKKGKHFNSNGTLLNFPDYYYTDDFIKVERNKIIIITSASGSNPGRLMEYNSNKVLIDWHTVYSKTLTLSQDTEYIRFSTLDPNIKLEYEEEVCTNKLDEQTNAINGLNDSLNDDDSSGATSEASDFFSSFTTDTFGLTSIITSPLNLVRSVLSSTCTELQLPLPYLDNKKLTLPCMSTIYSQFFGSFFTIYQTITYGIIAYWVCVRIFNQVKDFKNPEHDEIEVMDL